MVKINALGIACPIPVIMAKKAMNEHGIEEEIIICVDNIISTQNLEKMATSRGWSVDVKKIQDREYEVSMKFEGAENEELCPVMADTGEYVVVIDGLHMGEGDPQFGEKLLEGFIYSLTEQDLLPKIVVFYNKGVFHTTKEGKILEDLQTLASEGVEILSCGLCLNYYGLTDELKTGSVTNMYRIAEILRTHHVVKP